MNKKITGKSAEDLAVKFLENNGYQIVERNWKLAKIGEIDIIARKNKNFNFVEVKSLLKKDKFLPEQHFTKNKFAKIKKLAEFYVNQKNIDHWAISLLAIVFQPEIKINYYENVQI
jgi:putative endonuclease